jgi:hypothetical protein
MKNFKWILKLQRITIILKSQPIILKFVKWVNWWFKILYKTAPLKKTWGSFGHVEIYNKIDYFWNSEYAVFYKMAYLKIIY